MALMTGKEYEESLKKRNDAYSRGNKTQLQTYES